MEHVRVPDPDGTIERFQVCRQWPHDPPPVHQVYWDFGGYYPAGDWRLAHGWDSPHKIEQPSGIHKFPLKVYRRTADAVFELKQEFTVDTAERELTIAMTLYNRSGGRQQDVSLIRLVDFDIDNTGYDDQWLTARRSGVLFDSEPILPEYGNGSQDAASMTAPTTPYAVDVIRQSFTGQELSDFCVTGSSQAWGHHWNGFAYRFGNLAAGASRTVKFVYRAL